MHAPADDPSEALYRAAIGPRNTDFYLSKFRRFDEPGSSKLSWNWPAFFFFVGWFAYRRMFLEWGLYCLVIPIAMRLAAGIASRAVGLHTGHLIYDAASLAYAFLVIPLYANAMYWRAVRRRIDSVKREVDSPANQMAVLETGPHTSILWWVPVALVGVRRAPGGARASAVQGLRRSRADGRGPAVDGTAPCGGREVPRSAPLVASKSCGSRDGYTAAQPGRIRCQRRPGHDHDSLRCCSHRRSRQPIVESNPNPRGS
jgi:Protein of unknown function (DUF2628)